MRLPRFKTLLGSRYSLISAKAMAAMLAGSWKARRAVVVVVCVARQAIMPALAKHSPLSKLPQETGIHG
jgi:hypothetical protein